MANTDSKIHKYRITYGDGKTFDFQLKDGEDGDPADIYKFNVSKSDYIVHYKTNDNKELKKYFTLDIEINMFDDKEVEFGVFDANKNLISDWINVEKGNSEYNLTYTSTEVDPSESYNDQYYLKAYLPGAYNSTTKTFDETKLVETLIIPITYDTSGRFEYTDEKFESQISDIEGNVSLIEQDSKKIQLVAGGYKDYAQQTSWFRKQIKNLTDTYSKLGLSVVDEVDDADYIQVFQVKIIREGTTDYSHLLAFQTPVLSGKIQSEIPTYLVQAKTVLNPTADIYSYKDNICSITGNFGNDKYTLETLYYTPISLGTESTEYTKDSTWQQSSLDVTKNAIDIATENLTITASQLDVTGDELVAKLGDAKISSDNLKINTDTFKLDAKTLTGTIANAKIDFNNVNVSTEQFQAELNKCKISTNDLNITVGENYLIEANSTDGFYAGENSTNSNNYIKVNTDDGVSIESTLSYTKSNTNTTTYTVIAELGMGYFKLDGTHDKIDIVGETVYESEEAKQSETAAEIICDGEGAKNGLSITYNNDINESGNALIVEGNSTFTGTVLINGKFANDEIIKENDSGRYIEITENSLKENWLIANEVDIKLPVANTFTGGIKYIFYLFYGSTVNIISSLESGSDIIASGTSIEGTVSITLPDLPLCYHTLTIQKCKQKNEEEYKWLVIY